MTPEEQDELLKLLQGSTGSAAGPLDPLPDAAWAGSPIARMPFEPRGLPADASSAIDRMPFAPTGKPTDPRSAISPMDARRDADIEAFLGGAPIPQADAAAPPMPLPSTAPTPVRMPDAPDPLRSFQPRPPVGEPPTEAPPYRFADKPDPFGMAATLPGMRAPNERALQQTSRDKALLDFWARERADRPLLPEQAPEPRTYAEAQALHPRYRGDILSQFAETRGVQQNPALWSDFMATLPGAPRQAKPPALVAPLAPDPMGEAKLATERARAALLDAQARKALGGIPVATDGQTAEPPQQTRAAGVSASGNDDPNEWIGIVNKYAERGDIGDPSAYVARLRQAGAVHGKERGRVMQQVMKDVDAERRSRTQPGVTLDTHKREGLDEEEAALMEILPVLEQRARDKGDSRLPSAGNALQRGGVELDRWWSGGSGMDDTDTWINTRLNVAGQGAYKSQTGQVANQGQEQELSRQLYLGTGKYTDMLGNVRKRLEQIKVLREGSGPAPAPAVPRTAPRPQQQRPTSGASAPQATYTVTMPDGTVLEGQPLTMQQAIAARKRGARLVPN